MDTGIMCMYHMHAWYSQRSEVGIRQLGAAIWVLKIKSRSSNRATSALNLLVISLASTSVTF